MGDGDGKPDLSADRTAELSGRLRDLDRRLGARRAMDKPPSPRPSRAGEAGLSPWRCGLARISWRGSSSARHWVGGSTGCSAPAPGGLMVFLLLGFAAGILTVMRSAGLVKPGPAGPDDLFDGKRVTRD